MNPKNPINRLALGLIGAFALLFSYHAQATLEFYEPFSSSIFTDSSKLANTSPNGWNIGNSASGNPDQNSWITNIAALNYTGLVTLAGSYGVDRITSSGLSSRNVAKNLTNAITTGTAYCSFLINVRNAPTNNRAMLFLSPSVTTVPASVWLNSSAQLLVGKNSTSPQSSPTPALILSNTYLAVLKYTYNPGVGDDEVALYLSPVPGAAEPGSPTIATTTGADVTTITAVGLPQGRTSDQAYLGSSSGRAFMDEIRAGTTWADVTPAICTPGSIYNLTGGGALCLPSPGVSIDLSGSEAGVDYQLKVDGVDVGSPIAGTGAALNYGTSFTTPGLYTVTGSNTTSGCVYLMSGIVSITVATAPAITSSPTPVLGTNTVGEFRTYSVGATGTDLVYQWRHAGTNISDGGGYAGVTTPNLTIYPAALSHAGDYDCVVSGTCSPAATSGVANLFVKLPANLTWVGGGANLWNTSTANWTGDATVFATGDSVTINDSGNNTLPMDLVGSVSPVAINAANNTKDFIIGTTTSGVLAGTATLTKSSNGKLTLTTSNSFIGKVTVTGGTLSISADNRLGAVPGSVTTDQLTMNGGTLEVTAHATQPANRGTTLGASGGTYSVPTGFGFTNSSALTGAGAFTKIGGGTNLLNSAGSSFTGNMTINDGIVSAAASAGSGNNTTSPLGAVITTRTITVNNGATLVLQRGNVFAGGNTTVVTPAPHIIVNQGSTLMTRINDGNNFGKITLSGATFDLGIGHSFQAFGAAILTDTVTVGGSSASTISKDPFSLATAANLGFRGSTNGVIFDVADATGNSSADLNVNAPLWNAAPHTNALPGTPISLAKNGAGTMHLNDANIYTGLTVISNGVLAGSGSIAGSVEVYGSGKIGGGSDAGIGTLSVGGNLTFNGGGAYVRVDRSGPSSDSVSVTGTLVNNGTGAVTVNNLGAALQVGDAFTIFSQPVVNGNTLSVSGAGVTWTNKLAIDGTIQVLSLAVALPPSFPPGGVVRLPDGNISLTATGAIGATYKLWASTNVALTPVTNTWTLLSSGTVTVSPFTINDLTATNYPRRFYLFSAP